VDSTELVLRPDHPLLLRGPDALVGGNNNLCAVFFPHALEHNNPAHLASRLIASRLALPVHCRTLLVMDERDEPRFEALAANFSLISTKRDRSLRSFLRDNQDFGKSGPMDRKIQELANRTFDATLSLSDYSFRLARTKGRETVSSKETGKLHRVDGAEIRSGSFLYRPQNRVRYGEFSASFLSGRQRPTLTRQISAVSSGHLS
jgi:hypothetical protein